MQTRKNTFNSVLVLVLAVTFLALGCGGSGTQLTASPASISFGTVPVNSSASQAVTLGNSGTSTVSVSSASVAGPGFSVNGLTTPVSLAPGQTSSFSVTFTPSSTGAVTGNVSLVNTTAAPPLAIGLSGTGVTASAHFVTVSWSASTSNIIGYNVYRGSQSGGPYARLNPALIATTAYTDNAVVSGATYYYVTTAVNGSNAESVFSNQVAAVIPIP